MGRTKRTAGGEPAAMREEGPKITRQEIDDDRRGRDDEFVVKLTGAQNRLYIYILSLLPDRERAHDVLQQTNVIMWRKAAEYEPGTNFNAWACRIAHFEVLAERRRQHRDRHVFTEDALQMLSREFEASSNVMDERRMALEACLEKLPPRQRKHLMERYGPSGSVKDLAETLGKSRSAVAVMLFRIRQALVACIREKLNSEMER